MRVYSRVGRCCLTHFCTVKPNLHRTLERWTEKADHPSPFTFLCVSSCFSFRCFFLTLHQNHFQLACDSERLFSVGPGRFPGHFSGDDECTSLSGTLFRSQTVYSFQIPINYPFSRNNHLNKKKKKHKKTKNWTIGARQVCHTDSINKIKLQQCITRCCEVFCCEM